MVGYKFFRKIGMLSRKVYFCMEKIDNTDKITYI